MIPCENNIPDSSRYSLLHLGKGNMLDHIIASRPLLQYFRGAEIRRNAFVRHPARDKGTLANAHYAYGRVHYRCGTDGRRTLSGH